MVKITGKIKKLIDSLNNPELLILAEENENVKDISLKLVSDPQLILFKKDIDLSNIALIKGFSIETNETIEGSIKIILSNDSGENWYGYYNNKFQKVYKDNLNSISTYGINKSTLSSINANDWNDFLINKKLLIGILITSYDINNIEEISNINMKIIENGEWVSGVNGKDYTYKYTNDKMIMTANQGTWKINLLRSSNDDNISFTLENTLPTF